MRLQLHARAITVPLSKNKDAIKVEAPLPGHMREALAPSRRAEDTRGERSQKD
jgi:hypothetical protein